MARGRRGEEAGGGGPGTSASTSATIVHFHRGGGRGHHGHRHQRLLDDSSRPETPSTGLSSPGSSEYGGDRVPNADSDSETAAMLEDDDDEQVTAL